MLDHQPFQSFPPANPPIGSRSGYCNRSVWFAATDADQLLLQTIDHLLEAGDYSSFSELCKQALRAWLLPDEAQPDPLLVTLQQQLAAMQLQINQLVQQSQQSQQQSQPPAQLEAQVAALIERVAHLEDCLIRAKAERSPQEFERVPVSAMPVREPDPVLDRLVALLEDF